MPDLEEYARILQRLATEQEQDHINQLHQNLEPEFPENLQASPPVTPENEESCWVDDPLTSEDESNSQRSIMEAAYIEGACNVIVHDDSTSEALSTEATDSQNASGSISSGATYSQVTSTEITSSQPSSLETVTSEFKPLPTDHHEEFLVDEIFKENPVNWSQIPNLIGDVWTDEILDKVEKLLEAVQDLFPENALCNAITEDDNAAAEAFSVNGEDQPLEPEGGLPKEEPTIEAFEVGTDTDSDSETEDDASSSQADAQQVQPALTPLETPANVEDPTSATFIVPTKTREEKPIFFHRSDASSLYSLLEPFQNEGMPQLSLYTPMAQAIMKKMGYDTQNPIGLGGGRGILIPLEPTLTKSQLEDWKLHPSHRQVFIRIGASTSHINEDFDLPGYLFEELPDKDPGSSSNWYDFFDDEEELSDNTDARFFDLEEPSSPKEVPYFDPVSAEGLVELEASENIVEEPPSNLPTEDSVQKIDLGTLDNPRLVFISKNIKDDELPEYVSFLHEFVDCFAWSYAEMPGLDPKIAVHKLNLQENIKPVKQGQRRFYPDVMDKIEQEVQKLKNVGFIREEQHPEWLANIFPVTKKNGQIRVCIDYRDLNNTCPKDEFPLPKPEVMIDNTCGFERMTFMDGFSDYNQIKMHPEDERHTSFSDPIWRVLLHYHVIWSEKCRCNISKGYDEDIPRYAP
ncbi:hypothetical protein AAC387_Pa10g0803 [Persea americana]